MGRALPVLSFDLDDISVASPCNMAWADMVGGDKVRFCGACQKNVFNLSGMQRQEAMDLVRASEGRLCVRFFRREDGTVLTEDCPVGLRLALRRAKRLTLAAAATTVGAVATLVAFLGAGMTGKTCQRLQATRASIEQAMPDPPAMMGAPVFVPPPSTTPPPVPTPEPTPNVREIKGKVAPLREVMGDVALPSGG